MRGSLWLLLCLCCCLTAWSQDAAYQQRLQQADRLLQQAQQQPARAGTLAREAAGQLPDGAGPATRTAANSPTKENLTRARQEVQVLRQAASMRPTATGDKDPRTVMKNVLSRGEFQPIKRDRFERRPKPKWLLWLQERLRAMWRGIVRALNKFFNALGRFFRWLGSKLPRWRASSHRPSPLQRLGGYKTYLWYGILISCVLLLGVVIYVLVLRAMRRNAPSVRRQLLPGGAEHLPPAREPSYWEQSLEKAQALYAAGDEREAMRALQWACLILLDSRGMLRFDESRANGEVLRELRRKGLTSVQEHLRPVVRTFDRSWYGFLSVSPDDFLGAVESSRLFRQAVLGGT